jgi:hypothetical protein
MNQKLSKAEMFEELRAMLRDVFRLRSEGVAYARLSRAHGYVDGYMRGMLDQGVADKRELLALVSAVREASGGPATERLRADTAAA